MILQIPPDAPWYVHAAANTALVLHIGGGVAGLGFGAGALAFRKGGRLHRLSGKGFVASMLLMAGVAVIIAPLLPQRISIIAAVLALYLVVSGWRTVASASGRTGAVDWLLLAAPLGIVLAGELFGRIAAASPNGEIDQQAGTGAYVMAAIAGLAALCDIHWLLRRAPGGPQRIARRLWRMGVALLLAAGSFFQGQPQVFPEPLRGSPLLAVPTLAVLALTLFWLLRTLFSKTLRRRFAG